LENNCPLVAHVVALADACKLSREDWQTHSLLLIPPSMSSITATLLAEIHGRAGYFPPIVMICRTGDLSPRYAVTEIVNLQAVREDARLRRF